MNGNQQQPPEPKQMDVKKELARQMINLHNAKLNVQIQEAVVKKLQELAR